MTVKNTFSRPKSNMLCLVAEVIIHLDALLCAVGKKKLSDMLETMEEKILSVMHEAFNPTGSEYFFFHCFEHV
jgi:hypothetical protein